jgi:hypothetical protein
VSAVVVPDSVAVMTVDAGKVTGVAGAYLNLKRAATTEQALKRAVRKKAIQVEQITGSVEEQAWAIYHMWDRFAALANFERGIAIPDIHLCFESFQLRQKDAELWPAEINAGFRCIARGESGAWPVFSTRVEQRLHYQSPSQAKGYATDARLRKWNVWAVGLEHGRDATRHLALMTSRALNGELTDPAR